MQKTTIIGAGNMGNALYEGVRKATGEDNVYLCDRNESKLAFAPSHRRFTDAVQATNAIDCIVLAVKPQSFAELMDNIGDAWSSKFIVSVMAGIPLSRLEQLTGSSRIVRSMPNLGAKIHRSVTGWIASKDVTDGEKKHAQLLFESIGMSIELPAEDQIDAFTAIAGSGPAYVFGLAELLQNACRRLHLSDEVAAKIASEVIAAGSRLLEEGTMSASEWRKAVTSKGGVTEAAMRVIADKKLPEIFDHALEAGTQRSRSLSSDHE